MSPAFDVMKRTARFLRWSWLLLPSDLDTSADKDGAAVCLLDDDLSVLKATSRLLSFSGGRQNRLAISSRFFVMRRLIRRWLQ
jgi:hypothetical protein